MRNDANMATGDIRPDPDPTTRTTEGIATAVSSLEAVMKERFTAYDKAIELLQRKADKEPQISQVADSVAHLKELTLTARTDQKELLQQSVQSFKDLVEKMNELNDKALKAAFDASSKVVENQQSFNEKASLKAEASFIGQVGELQKRLELMSGGLTDKVSALDRRVTSTESIKAGGQAAWGYVLGGVGLMVAVAAIVFHH